jgi:hypothetical protein
MYASGRQFTCIRIVKVSLYSTDSTPWTLPVPVSKT